MAEQADIEPSRGDAGRLDDACLAAAVLGDEAAWRRVYDDVAPAVLRYLQSRGVRDAEDVLGDTFLDAARSLHAFEGDMEHFRSWIFTIAHHRMVDHHRRQARQPSEPRGDIEAAMPPDLRDGKGIVGAAQDIADEHFHRSQLHTLIRQLAPDQRDVLLLVYVADLSLVDTAGVLGKSVGAVKALHLRGLQSLRRRLAVSPAVVR